MNRRLRAAAAVFLACAAAAPASAAAPRPLPGEDVELRSLDGWTLKARYLPAREGRKTLLLLHGTGQRKEAWVLLARELAAEGYGVFGLDLRGHGESLIGPDGQAATWRKFRTTKLQNDFADMDRDIQAAVSTLTARGVAEESIGFVGEGVGGSVGLKYAAVHPKIAMIVMLSPGMSYQEVTTVNAMLAYKNRPILMVYSEEDKLSSKATPLLNRIAQNSAGQRHAALIAVPEGRGMKLVTRELAARIVAWLGDPVAPETPEVSTTSAVSPEEPAPEPLEDEGAQAAPDAG